ncbi:MAG: tRNA threonylcarbamoyladenosine dehydratase [Geobacteraceae bacterium]|nr:tRNA threonylcarbamoyladenosine dehydratase [Geobacteraceae bacterium]
MTEPHRFSRTELLIGSEGLENLRKSTVAVFGLGGVGGHAAEALCRAGVGRLVLVDFDDVCLTNMNRQILALSDTVGKAKALLMAERMRKINPDAEIVPCKDFYSAENSGYLLSESYDYVLDAIDSITSKLHLIGSCRERSIPIVSSMGAAAKLDPTKIKVADISETHKCRMARIMRKLLKRRGIDRGVKVVFSTEERLETASTDSRCREGCECPSREDADFPCRHRKITLGSVSFIPAIFGFTMAGVAVNELLAAHLPGPTPPK